jgi:hypothetical protein
MCVPQGCLVPKQVESGLVLGNSLGLRDPIGNCQNVQGVGWTTGYERAGMDARTGTRSFSIRVDGHNSCGCA